MTRARDLANIIGPNGDLVVTGDLQVSGTTTTVNSTTVEIADKNILLGSGATANSQNSGAGLSVLLPDASPDEFATILWDATGTKFDFSHGASFLGNVYSGTLIINPQDGISEGGEIILSGAGSNEDIYIDNYAGTFRIFDPFSPTIRLTINSSGDATLTGNLNISPNTLKPWISYHRGVDFGGDATPTYPYGSLSARVDYTELSNNFYSNASAVDIIANGAASPGLYASRFYQSNGGFAFQRSSNQATSDDTAVTSWINALTIDSSSAATFTGVVNAGTGLRLFTDGSGNSVISQIGQDKSMYFAGDDGGVGINALVLDMANGGAATFAGTISSGTQTLVADTSVIQSIRNPNTAWEQYALTRYGTESANFRYMDFGYYRGTTEATRGLVIKSQANATLFTFLDSGEFQVGTTTVIDSSRNYVGPYFNSSSSVNFSGEGGLQIDSGYRLGFNENGVRSWNMKATGGSLVVTSGDGNGGFDISGPELKIGGQTVIDSSRNITAGNIISGSGATGSVIGGIRAYGSSNAFMCAGDADGKTAFFGVDNSGYAMFGALTNHDAVIRANNNEYLRVKTNSNVNVVSGALEIGGTPVIDSSRNLVNLNGSIKSDTVFAFLTNADAAQDVRTKSVFAGTSYGDTPPAGSFNATNTYELNGTTVIDSSRNLTNIGTISSGTITSTGDIVASKFEFNSNSIFNGRIGDTSGSFFYTGTTVPTSFWDINNLGNGNLIMTLSDAGAMSIAGTLTQSASDERLKTNIKNIENPLEKLKKIRGVEFDWLDNIEETHQFKPRYKHETGVIAQEIEQVIPDAVSPAPFNNEYKTVEKDKLVALLIEAVKEQQKQIEELKELFINNS